MMNRTDRKLRRLAKQDRPNPSQEFSDEFLQTLEGLPEKQPQKQVRRAFLVWRTVLVSCAALAVTVLVILPNISTNIASAMEQIPVLREIVRVTTIRNYFYDDGYHNLEADIPSVDIDGDSPTASDAENYINSSVQELTDALIDRFYADVDSIGNEGHTQMKIDYTVVTNTDNWFTLKLQIFEASGSSNTYYKFYHIDKKSGKIVYLSDLFLENSNYKTAISEEIKRQMEAEMEKDSSIYYWLHSEVETWNFTNISDQQNFYFSENGNIVIAFDKYEVAPGAMGCPEFEIPKEIYQDSLKPEYKS